MKRNLLIPAVLLFCSIINVYPQKSPKDKGLDAITMDAIRGQLEFLSSDWMEGRATGEKGSFLAASYIASMFKVFGAAPAGDAVAGGQGGRQQMARSTLRPSSSGGTASYFQNFTLIETLPGGQATLSVNKSGKEYTFLENVDFTAGRMSLSTKFEAPVVFVGYGIVDKAHGIDDFAGVDVKGKVVLRLPGFPGSNDQNSPMYKKLTSGNLQTTFEMTRRKNETLANLGAAAVIDITTGNDIAKRWGTYMFDFNPAYAESGPRTNWNRMALDGKEITSSPVTLTVTERVINLMLKETGIDLAKYEKDAAAGILKFKPVVIPGLKVTFSAEVKTRRVNVRNIIAMIEGENRDEIVAVGAHMDHMGMDNGKIWNGADDNASGTVGVMTLAKAFIESGVKPKRTIVFCAWTGEEKGLLGSEYFTLYPTVGKISNYKFYLNFDMISRDAANDTLKNMAGITYTKAYPKLEEITRKYVEEYKLNLKLSIRSADAPTGGSDYTAFTDNKVPVIAWMAAMHPEYHQPGDEVNLVNWNKMLSIIKLAYLQLWEAANGDIK
ncbi:MAG TPA: M20/M25/M40 family metallo-hydrolase [Bacteroidales bacterium]|nr:M20/M25/M40 family metallo-hydrolase [Bacteroidales bacterium]HRT90650.1 M20/M25/M40 family metallo-hydrolase [Bacteroidales bacterium]